MFNFPRHLPELIAYGTGITAALRGKAGGRAGAQRRQIENDVKKILLSFVLRQSRGTILNPGAKSLPLLVFLRGFPRQQELLTMAEDLRTDAKGPVDFSRLSDIVFHGVYWLLSIHLLLLVGLFVICLWNSWMSVAVYYLSGIWPSSLFITFSSQIPGAVLELGSMTGNVLQIALAVWLWSFLCAWDCALMNVVTVIFDHFRNWLPALGNIVIMSFASCFYIAMMASVSRAFS